MFQDLVRLRKTDEVFSLQGREGVEGAVLSDRALVLRFFGRDSERLLIINFGADLLLAPVPEPLLAPPQGHQWQMVFSTENPHYSGGGIAAIRLEEGWRIEAEAATVFASQPSGADDGRIDSQNTA
jgi:maltooligosyltrehalose trehalohydrolase